MKIGIIGLSGSGKSTVFSLLAGSPHKEEESQKIRLGTVKLADERLKNLAAIFNPKKVTYPELTFVDFPGFDCKNIQDVELLVAVLGLFANSDPTKDSNNLQAELILADIEKIQKRLPTLKKEVAGGSDSRELELLERCNQHLEAENFLFTLPLAPDEDKFLRGYDFLTRKPLLFVANVGEQDLGKGVTEQLGAGLGKKGLKLVEISAKIELEISQLSEPEQKEFLQDLGIKAGFKENLLKAILECLNIVIFYTVKGEENKAWIINRGTQAREAAGKIHSDIKKGFIKAEVINYKDFMECGSFAGAKEKGKLRLERKEYGVQDGDIINFRFAR